jgi:hypothetical protein
MNYLKPLLVDVFHFRVFRCGFFYYFIYVNLNTIGILKVPLIYLYTNSILGVLCSLILPIIL